MASGRNIKIFSEISFRTSEKVKYLNEEDCSGQMTQKCKMDLMALMNSRIDQIIETVGSGMKSLISDEDTMKSVSLSCPQSRIMKKEVFLFEVLHSRCVNCKRVYQE